MFFWDTVYVCKTKSAHILLTTKVRHIEKFRECHLNEVRKSH